VKENVILNEQITAPLVKLVLSDGHMKGEVSIEEALNVAYNEGLDLLQVSDGETKSPPICKIVNYGKIKYNKSKQKHSKEVITKEIRFSYSISDHDLQVKHNHVKEFIKKHYKVKYMMCLKGRQRTMVDNALLKFEENLRDFDGLCQFEKINVSSNVISTFLLPN